MRFERDKSCQEKNDTSLNSCRVPTSLEEVWNLDAVSSVASDNSGSEFNNDIVTETDDSDDVSVKPFPPSGM